MFTQTKEIYYKKILQGHYEEVIVSYKMQEQKKKMCKYLMSSS
jgi:hypothetical protein